MAMAVAGGNGRNGHPIEKQREHFNSQFSARCFFVVVIMRSWNTPGIFKVCKCGLNIIWLLYKTIVATFYMSTVLLTYLVCLTNLCCQPHLYLPTLYQFITEPLKRFECLVLAEDPERPLRTTVPGIFWYKTGFTPR